MSARDAHRPPPQTPFRALWDLDCACSKLTGSERALAQLASYHGGKTQRFFLAQSMIAAMLGVDERTVRRAQAGLVKAGLLRRLRDWSPGKAIEFELRRNRAGERALMNAARMRAEQAESQRLEAEEVSQMIDESFENRGDSAPDSAAPRTSDVVKPDISCPQTRAGLSAHAEKNPKNPGRGGPPKGTGAALPAVDEVKTPSKPELRKVRPQSEARRHRKA